MYIGHFEYRPDRLDSLQVNRAEVLVILIGWVHRRNLWCLWGFYYTSVGTVSLENFVN